MSDRIAQQRLWFTADHERVVLEGDPDAAFLLAGVGSVVPERFVGISGLGSIDVEIPPLPKGWDVPDEPEDDDEADDTEGEQPKRTATKRAATRAAAQPKG